eukprot:gnl/MRDRNA2_/MRDRNA2_76878_c0_seq2.p1 gnl/MRDRNA2_/MRDRNA2_76878_c0~~gnl/MRDRNA2_/MRDRNA2_76878_c0_seq2.p1  ORF type:complete len:1472 (-),score=463.90 gnl/MRDRNA2_/MRDRNA2_76878_c0_seq2:66-4481(-)
MHQLQMLSSKCATVHSGHSSAVQVVSAPMVVRPPASAPSLQLATTAYQDQEALSNGDESLASKSQGYLLRETRKAKASLPKEDAVEFQLRQCRLELETLEEQARYDKLELNLTHVEQLEQLRKRSWMDKETMMAEVEVYKMRLEKERNCSGKDDCTVAKEPINNEDGQEIFKGVGGLENCYNEVKKDLERTVKELHEVRSQRALDEAAGLTLAEQLNQSQVEFEVMQSRYEEAAEKTRYEKSEINMDRLNIQELVFQEFVTDAESREALLTENLSVMAEENLSISDELRSCQLEVQHLTAEKFEQLQAEQDAIPTHKVIEQIRDDLVAAERDREQLERRLKQANDDHSKMSEQTEQYRTDIDKLLMGLDAAKAQVGQLEHLRREDATNQDRIAKKYQAELEEQLAKLGYLRREDAAVKESIAKKYKAELEEQQEQFQGQTLSQKSQLDRQVKRYDEQMAKFEVEFDKLSGNARDNLEQAQQKSLQSQLQVEQYESENSSLTAQVAEYEGKIDQLRIDAKAAQELSERFQHLMHQSTETNQQVKHFEIENASLAETAAKHQMEITQLLTDASAAQKMVAQLEDQISKGALEIEHLANDKQQVQETLAHLEQLRGDDFQEHEEFAEHSKFKALQICQELRQKEEHNCVLAGRLDLHQQEIDKLRESQLQVSQELEHQEAQNVGFAEQLGQYEFEIKKLQGELDAKNQSIEKQESRTTLLAEQLAQNELEIKKLQGELDANDGSIKMQEAQKHAIAEQLGEHELEVKKQQEELDAAEKGQENLQRHMELLCKQENREELLEQKIEELRHQYRLDTQEGDAKLQRYSWDNNQLRKQLEDANADAGCKEEVFICQSELFEARQQMALQEEKLEALIEEKLDRLGSCQSEISRLVDHQRQTDETLDQAELLKSQKLQADQQVCELQFELASNKVEAQQEVKSCEAEMAELRDQCSTENATADAWRAEITRVEGKSLMERSRLEDQLRIYRQKLDECQPEMEQKLEVFEANIAIHSREAFHAKEALERLRQHESDLEKQFLKADEDKVVANDALWEARQYESNLGRKYQKAMQDGTDLVERFCKCEKDFANAEGTMSDLQAKILSEVEENDRCKRLIEDVRAQEEMYKSKALEQGEKWHTEVVDLQRQVIADVNFVAELEKARGELQKSKLQSEHEQAALRIEVQQALTMNVVQRDLEQHMDAIFQDQQKTARELAQCRNEMKEREDAYKSELAMYRQQLERLRGQAQYGELTLTQYRSDMVQATQKNQMQSSLDKAQASAEIYELRTEIQELQKIAFEDKSQLMLQLQQAQALIDSNDSFQPSAPSRAPRDRSQRSSPSRAPRDERSRVRRQGSEEPLRIEMLRMLVEKLEEDCKKERELRHKAEQRLSLSSTQMTSPVNEHPPVQVLCAQGASPGPSPGLASRALVSEPFRIASQPQLHVAPPATQGQFQAVSVPAPSIQHQTAAKDWPFVRLRMQ